MESERLERYKRTFAEPGAEIRDELLGERIRLFLNDPRITSYNMVDAYYYDFSALPYHLSNKYYRDMYLLFGITDECEIITKWVERYHLDSDKEIINGEVIKE